MREMKVKSVEFGVISATCDIVELMKTLKEEKGGKLSSAEVLAVVRDSIVSVSSVSSSGSVHSQPTNAWFTLPGFGNLLIFLVSIAARCLFLLNLRARCSSVSVYFFCTKALNC
jgi:hypothetical protein